MQSEQHVTEKDVVLFTGTGERMIENMIAILPPRYEAVRCLPIDTEFYRAMRKKMPAAVVVCMQNETREQLRVYDTLYEDHVYEMLPVIALGYEDDCAQFRSRLPLKRLQVFHRPVNQEAFLQELAQGIAESKEEQARQVHESTVRDVPQIAARPNQQAGDESAPLNDDKKLLQKLEHATRMSGRKNVLVVDDDVGMLNVIKFYLESLYDVTVVPSGKLALKYIEKKPVDIVLLDYMMPEMDGPEVLRIIRTQSAQPQVPVLFLTGVSDKDLVLRCLELRPNGYLLKPVSRESLLEKVTEIVLGL